MKYYLYGHGDIAHQAKKYLGTGNILVFFVSNVNLEENNREHTPVIQYSKDRIRFDATDSEVYPKVVISVNPRSNAAKEISARLAEDGVPFCFFEDVKRELTRKKILSRPDYIGIYKKAIQWIEHNNINKESIINNSDLRKGYPEVTGYYIPTLLDWGYRDLAASFGKWLVDIQKPNGAWYDTFNEDPYVFDSGQILKGLLAIRRSVLETGLPFAYSVEKLDTAILKGCDWILSNMAPDGMLTTPSEKAWDLRSCSDLIHLYCLQPLREASNIYNKPEYEEKVQKILDYYLTNRRNEILHFSLLSHFWSYVMEALVDLRETDIAEQAMRETAALQDQNGFVPAYSDVHWCCSTGLFQQALVWYKLCDIAHGNKAFEYACKLQNKTGGWYGSYPNPDYPQETTTYFPNSEISWAVKYFLDALHYKNLAEFDEEAPGFKEHYDKNDGRYCIVRDTVKTAIASSNSKEDGKVLDLGCGKGAYIRNLLVDIPEASYYGVDISSHVMSFIKEEAVHTKQGSLTSIPYPDNSFDVTYACESLEHAIDIPSAIREMARVTKLGGSILIIDKNEDQLGNLEIEKWEQWFDVDELADIMKKYCSEVSVQKEVGYEKPADGLFCAWRGIVK